jgi:hypothetical protein
MLRVRSLGLVAVCLPIVVFAAPALVINEVMSNPNGSAPAGQEFGFYDAEQDRVIISDWVELYNPGDEPVQASGLFLSDDCQLKAQWEIPFDTGGLPIMVEAKSFLVIWCPGYYRGVDTCPDDVTKVCPVPIDPDKANFRVSSNGEWVGLYTAEGELIDGIDLPPMPVDRTFGCFPDGDTNGRGYLAAPTIGVLASGTMSGGKNEATVNLGPIIDIRSYRGIVEVEGREEYTLFVEPDQSVRVLADVEDLDDPDPLDGDNHIVEVLLHWKLAGPGAARPITMNAIESPCPGRCTYRADIEGQADGSVVEFFITAQDRKGAIATAYLNEVAERGFLYPVGDVGTFDVPLVINEVLAVNSGCPDYDEGEEQDPTAPRCGTGGEDRGANTDRRQGDDWLELYNTGTDAVPLSDLYVTNNELFPTRLPLKLADGFHLNVESGALPGQTHMLIWCDDEPGQNDSVGFHAPFTLSGNEDEVFLVAYRDANADGNPEVFRFVDHIVWGPAEGRTIGRWLGPQDGDWSLGRYPDGNEDAGAWGRMVPSPGISSDFTHFPGGPNTPLVPFLNVSRYEPVSPAVGEEVTFFARAWDDKPLPDGAVTLRIGGKDVPMHDDGAGGDVTAGDGIYTAAVQDPQLAGTVRYRATVTDADGNVVTFPAQDLNPAIFFGDLPAVHLVLSEVVAANRQCPCTGSPPAGCELAGVDNFADADDWVEIWNPTESSLDLGAYYLTDRLNWLTRSKLPEVILAPGQRVVIWCDGEPEEEFPENPAVAKAYHAKFLLDAGGDEVALVLNLDPTGSVKSQIVDFIRFEDQVSDISSGRDGETGELGMLLTPTLEVPNARLAANAEWITELGEPIDPLPLQPGQEITVMGRALDQATHVFIVNPEPLGDPDDPDWDFEGMTPETQPVELVKGTDWSLQGEDLKVKLPLTLAPGPHLLCVLSGHNATWYDGGVPWTRIAFSVAGSAVAPVSITRCEIDGGGIAHLAWTNGADDYQGIDLLIDGVAAAGSPLPGTATSFESPALAPGPHTFVVRPFVGADKAPAVTCTAGGAIFLRGDANGDADVNVADAVAILQWLFLSPNSVTCPDAADTNDDERTNVADAVYLLQYLFINGPAIPPPFPIGTCGPDPTGNPNPEDDLPACEYTSCP